MKARGPKEAGRPLLVPPCVPPVLLALSALCVLRVTRLVQSHGRASARRRASEGGC